MVSLLLFYGSLILVIVYFFMVTRWTLSWKLASETALLPASRLHASVSIVVAVRNEEGNMERLLDQLYKQNYPVHLFEIVISDDQSTDDTVPVVERYMERQRNTGIAIRVLTAAAEEKPGKKAALTRAIENVRNELIVLTDADCTMGEHWLSSIVSCYQATGASMITGMVRLHPLKGGFARTEALEFLSLTATGAASVVINKPLMCNGANLAFTRQSFVDSGGYGYGSEQASGDDTFFMLRLVHANSRVVFNKSPLALVSTLPLNSLLELIAQRKRWASKIAAYNETYIKVTGLFIILVNFMLLLTLPALLIGLMTAMEAAILWGTKGLADFLFLAPVTSYAGQRNLLLLFLPLLLLYPVYVLAGMLMVTGSGGYSWKGRNYGNN